MKNTIISYIINYVQNYKEARQTATAWTSPIVGFADANDSLFTALKESGQQNHLMPEAVLHNAKTVIAYFIPFERSIVNSNRTQSLSSKEWARAYVETNQLIVDLNDGLAREISALGYQSASMMPTHNFDEEALVSDWSHKHIGYIAGLGTFGLHQMLITQKGCCGRIGSLVTEARIEPSPKPEEEYCKYKYDRTCKVCIKRCPTGALRENSFDRHRCYALCLKNAEFHKNEGLADVCGKCMSVVPCSFQKPYE